MATRYIELDNPQEFFALVQYNCVYVGGSTSRRTLQERIDEGYKKFGGDKHIAYVLSVASCIGLENLEMTLKAAETFAINLSKYINSEPTANIHRVSNSECKKVGFVYAFAKMAKLRKRPVIQNETELEIKFLELQSRLQNYALDLQAFRWRNQSNGIRGRDSDDDNDDERGRVRSKSTVRQATARVGSVTIADLDVGDLDITPYLGLELYVGPRGGVYSLYPSGRKKYYPELNQSRRRRAESSKR